VGLRRWSIIVLAFAVGLGSVTEAVNQAQGPYDVNCVSQSRGFEVILTSWKTGQATSLPFPIGGCPGQFSWPGS
jgi:hypothetical protein